MTHRRTLTVLMTAAALAAVVVWATGPSAPRPVALTGATDAPRSIRGAFHIHTTRSDGALDKRAVAKAAARAGLQFAVFTDHGNGTREPDPPEYIEGVLCLDAVEISTNQGHYIALGMAAAPYPLGGDAAAVAEDVARLGGLGIAAHPISARTELAWSDWDIPIDGLEWLNADSEWRDEGHLRLARSLLDYWWRPRGALASLLDRPAEAFRQWDHLASTRQVVGLAGHDAHGGLGAETGGQRGRRLHIPSYEASFRTFSLHVIPQSTLTGEASRDAETLLTSLRRGAVYTVIDAVARPASLDFAATLGDVATSIGGVLPRLSGVAAYRIRAAVPHGATTLLKRNGVTVARTAGGMLDHSDAEPGAYRVEIEVSGAPGTPPVPWIVTNPIYRHVAGGANSSAAASPPPVVLRRLMGESWRVESDSASSGTVSASGETVSLSYRLKQDPRTSQFVALVVDLREVPADTTAIVLDAESVQPMRLSAQLRFAEDHDQRWGRSVYLDTHQREIRLPIARLRYLGSSRSDAPATRSNPQPPPISRATSLLFVVDLTNTVPGAEGTFTLSNVALAK